MFYYYIHCSLNYSGQFSLSFWVLAINFCTYCGMVANIFQTILWVAALDLCISLRNKHPVFLWKRTRHLYFPLPFPQKCWAEEEHDMPLRSLFSEKGHQNCPLVVTFENTWNSKPLVICYLNCWLKSIFKLVLIKSLVGMTSDIQEK